MLLSVTYKNCVKVLQGETKIVYFKKYMVLMVYIPKNEQNWKV